HASTTNASRNHRHMVTLLTYAHGLTEPSCSEYFGEMKRHNPVPDLLAHDQIPALGVQRDAAGHLQEAPTDRPAGRHIAVVIDAECDDLADVVELLRPGVA